MNKSGNSATGDGMKSKLKLVVLTLVVCAIGGGWYWYQNRQQAEQDEPLLVAVRMGSIENTISAAGRLKPSNYVDVGAQVNGILQRLHVDVGDEVEEGQLLAEIDARVQEQRVDGSRASLEGLRAQLVGRQSALELSRINAARQERLRDEDATSELEYDTAMNNLANAEANLIQLEKQIQQSEASLQTEMTQLEFTKIFAPVSGTVTSIAMNEGRTLNANQQAPTILTIANLDVMTVETEISEADIGKVKKGMEVYFTTLGSGDRRWYGELRQILPTPTVTNNVVLYTGLFDIENSDGALLPEMTTQVYFVTSSADNVKVVPMGALSFIESQSATGAGEPTGTSFAAAGNDQPPQMTEEMRQRIQQARQSGNLPAGGFNGGGGRQAVGTARMPRPGERTRALVTVMKDDGTREQREVLIGLTSRVNAEVITGLEVGEQVVAGILESAAPVRESGNDSFRPRFMRF